MNISSQLINWYCNNKRDLPWRNTKDPYTIWIAEVILQQTRVNQGLQYFRRFMERFPDLPALAGADTDEVMKIWQGLGYYSRARNLHETARYIVQHHDGKMPGTFSGLMVLKGIGSYTAAAIASFAFDEEVPVVDGNVVRVLSRLFGVYSVNKNIFFEKSREIMEPGKTALFNQALMEFGALHCTPVRPLCPSCMFRDECFAYQRDAVRELPVKREKTKLKKRYFHYFIIRDDQNLLMKKRDGNDIWEGLYDFPLIETKRSVSLTNLRNLTVWKELFGSPVPEIMNYSTIRRHILTHQVIFARFYLIGGITPRHLTGHQFMVVQLEQLRDLPIPRLIDRFLQETDWLVK
jgi:A/G-specific adenine glycosylase